MARAGSAVARPAADGQEALFHAAPAIVDLFGRGSPAASVSSALSFAGLLSPGAVAGQEISKELLFSVRLLMLLSMQT